MTELDRLRFRMHVAQQRVNKWAEIAMQREEEYELESLRLQAIESVKKMDHPVNTHDHE